LVAFEQSTPTLLGCPVFARRRSEAWEVSVSASGIEFVYTGVAGAGSTLACDVPIVKPRGGRLGN
jgi:hypothetical protein